MSVIREFKIHGMDWAEEIAILKKEIGRLTGKPDRLAFDLLNGNMTVSAPDEAVTVGEIIRAVAQVLE